MLMGSRSQSALSHFASRLLPPQGGLEFPFQEPPGPGRPEAGKDSWRQVEGDGLLDVKQIVAG